MKVDILAIGAHPDDVELSCAGTLAKEISGGKKVAIVDLTQGELGTRGSAQLRAEEAAKAASILGVSHRFNLGFADGFFQNDEEHQRKLIEYIRLLQPDVVLCNAVSDRHPDHGRAAKLVVESCFLSGLAKVVSTLDDRVQQSWRPKQLYHYLQWNSTQPDFVVDISEYMETKMEAVQAYGSQFYKPNATEAETPISSQNFLNSIQYRAADLGRIIGVDYAEGFTSHRLLAVQTISHLI